MRGALWPLSYRRTCFGESGWGEWIRTTCLSGNSRAHEPIVLHPNKSERPRFLGASSEILIQIQDTSRPPRFIITRFRLTSFILKIMVPVYTAVSNRGKHFGRNYALDKPMRFD